MNQKLAKALFVLAGDTRKRPTRWEEITGIQVLDEDGWRSNYERDNLKPKPWKKQITFTEFVKRAGHSTVSDLTIVNTLCNYLEFKDATAGTANAN